VQLERSRHSGYEICSIIFVAATGYHHQNNIKSKKLATIVKKLSKKLSKSCQKIVKNVAPGKKRRGREGEKRREREKERERNKESKIVKSCQKIVNNCQKVVKKCQKVVKKITPCKKQKNNNGAIDKKKCNGAIVEKVQ
jgi:hypothetical protein